MAKKSRKARSTNRAAIAPKTAAAATSQVKTEAQKPSRQQASASAGAVQTVDYRYVAQDLIRIGIITAALILILIVLMFIPALRS